MFNSIFKPAHARGIRTFIAPPRHIALFGLASLASGLLSTVWAGTIVTNVLLAGTRFETPCYLHDSGLAGPTVMIVGGAHGNEPAGAAAAESIRHWPITAGKLVVIPRANVPGLTANTRRISGLATNLSDLNRNYPRAGREESARGDVATAIWNVALAHQPTWLFDLHEGYDFHQLNEKSVGSSVIAASDLQSQTAATVMLTAVNDTITNPPLKFVRRGPPIDGSLARAASEHLKIPAMTVETTSKQDLSRRVAQHETMMRAFLTHVEMLPAREAAPVARAANSSSAIRIALYKGPGTGGAGPVNLMKRLDDGDETTITEVTPEQIGAGVLTNYDVAIFAGGSGSKQAEALGEAGRAAVQEFVGHGGGYIGICAGAYLATSGYSWSLKLINAKTVSPKWRRGRGDVKLELTHAGKAILGERQGQFDVRYANGPIIQPADQTNLPPFTTLAWFRSELAENDTPAGVMVNSPAIFAAAYQRGLVVCVSPHPEQTAGLEDFIPQAVKWVVGKAKPEAPKALSNSE
jgi:predicted deacylase